MNLDRLLAKNRELALAAVALHQSGRVRANTYLIDLEMLDRNARIIKRAADEQGLSL